MKKTMSKRGLRVVVFATVGLFVLWQGVALAGDAPAPPSAPSGDAPAAPEAPSSETSETEEAPSAPQTAVLEEDVPGHTTTPPSGDSHAGAGVAQVNLAGEDALTVNDTNSSISNNDEGHGDVTVLAIGGNEIVGAHSDSDGTESDSAGLALLCEESDGQLCIGLLYASTESNNSGSTTTSSSDASLVFLCVGGTTTAPGPVCDGPVGAEVGGSHSTITENRNVFTSGGSTFSEETQTAHAETELADVCLGGEDASGVCTGLGVSAVGAWSDSSATDPDAPGTTDSDSWVLAIEAQGARTQILGDSQELLSIPPGCPEDGSLLCIFLNQGDEVLENGVAGNRVETIHLDVLKAVGQIPGDSLILAHLGTAETLVTATLEEVQGPECPPGTTGTFPDCVDPDPPCPDGFVLVDGECIGGENGKPRNGQLAFTGFGALPLLALSLILGTGGGSVLAWDRRRGDSR